MSALLEPLPPHEARAVDALRAAMDRAGSAFDFVVHRVPAQAGPAGEAHHRAALQSLFDAFAAAWPALRFDLGQAVATPLDAQAVMPAAHFPPGWRVDCTRDPARVSWFEWLAQAFDDPPYTLQCDDPGLHAELFPRFCACTGLVRGEGIEVLDWVGDPERDPGRSDWSNYFEDGKEWWGIWCLTVWNPRHRTLAAIAASTTD